MQWNGGADVTVNNTKPSVFIDFCKLSLCSPKCAPKIFPEFSIYSVSERFDRLCAPCNIHSLWLAFEIATY